ncbi:uncharacterized protein [Drosophila takahashii]|uniref:uncharacterized protein isoform X1 n=2 Tax=Drosophila takahashii TaxID=29030 RepID=UPI003898DA46
MNSCCCRSHSDRTDPMACLPQFASSRLQRVQSCRPYLEGRRAASCCVSSERRWGQRNGGMIQLLANMLFARILYPLILGWNTLKIPFVLPDTCELYYGIFDECGNLRKPIPTRTLLILITMMQYFLNLPKVCKRNNKCCSGCKNKDDSLQNIHNPGYCGKDAMLPFSRIGMPGQPKSKSPGSEVWAGLRRLGYQKGGDLESYPSDESIPYGYAPARCPCQSGYYNEQRSRREFKNPYANMTAEMRSQACEEILQSPMLANDCVPSARSQMAALSPQAAQLVQISHISDLYAAVVQNQHSRRLLQDGKPPKPRVKPCTENRRRFSGGFMMPEPYFNGMPWSWLHRDPQRRVRLPSGGLPTDVVPWKYKEYNDLGYKYENFSRLVNPFKESSLLPIEPKRFQPVSWEQKIKDLGKFPIKLPLGEKRKLEWEELLLKRVTPAGKPKGGFDYWSEMMERNQLRRTIDRERIRNPIFPITRERSYSPAGKDIARMIMPKSNNSLKSARKTPKNSFENKKPTSTNQTKIKRINSGRKDNVSEKPIKETKPRERHIKKSVNNILQYEKIEKSSKRNYPDPEDYRKEISRNRRYHRKIAGECLMLIKPYKENIPAEDLKKKIKRRGTSPERFVPPGGGDHNPKYSKTQDVRPKPKGLLKGTDDRKIIFKPRAKSPESDIKKIRFQSNDLTEKSRKSQKIYYGSTKSKTNELQGLSSNNRTKIAHSRGESTEKDVLNNRRKKSTTFSNML